VPERHRSTTAWFAAALAFGLLVRAASLPLPGHDDIIAWKIWSYAAAHDVTSMYGVGGTPPTRGEVTWGDRSTTVNYPPVFLYEYAIVGRVFGALFPSYPDGLALLIAVKLPVLLANVLLTAVLYFGVRRLSKGSVTAARWAALAYWLNPATIFGGELLGYVDPLCFLPAIAGLVAASIGRPWLAGLLVGLAVATKPQGLLIGPALAVALWQSGGAPNVVRAGVTFAASLIAVGLPYYWRDALPNMWLAFGSFGERRDTMSAYAANIGWIINWYLRSRLAIPALGARAFLQRVPRPLAISRVRELGYPNPTPIGRAAVVAAAAWAMWTARRSRDFALAAAVGAFTVHAFFVLATGVHENHQLLEIPLLVLAASLRLRFRPLFIVVSGIVTLNINYLYGLGLGIGWNVPRMITGVDLSVLLAFLNVGVLVWFAKVLRVEATEGTGRTGTEATKRTGAEITKETV
jgi:hypothetical protein